METFYGSSTGRSNTVFITKDYGDIIGRLNDNIFTCWSGKVLRSIMIVGQGIRHSPCSAHHAVRCDDCWHKLEPEHCFVQRYEFMCGNVLKVDAIDRALTCLGIKWHRNPGDHTKFEAKREFGFVPVETILEVAHVVRIDPILKQVSFDKYRSEP